MNRFDTLLFRSLLTAALCCLSGICLAAPAPRASYTVLDKYPHNTALFTQGLELYRDRLFESSGLYGRSKVISRAFPPGHDPDLKGLALPDSAFAEGLTVYRDRLYLLTWRAQRGLILDPHHFGVLGAFAYPGEGWGLCFHSGLGKQGHFVMSNGSATLQWLAPDTMKVSRRLQVTDDGKPVTELNELECVGRYVVANIWQSDDIVFIDAKTGKVLSRLDLSALKPEVQSDQAVLNGIAYDASDDSWLVTGKFWPVLYRLRISQPQEQ